MRRTGRVLGGVVLALVVFAGAAGAASPGTLPSPKADGAAPVIPAGVPVARVHTWLGKALSVRRNALTADAASVAAARTLTAQDRAALGAIISADQAGISGLATALPSDRTLPQLQAAADTMVLDYRVFSLLAPQLRAVVATDRELAKAAALVALEPSIQTAITTEKQAGHRPGVLEKLYQRLVALLGTLETSLAGSSTALLALTPQGDASAPATFVSSATTLTAAASQLGTARADVHRILKDLGGS